jgi:Uncharacterized conserved protein
MTDTIRKQYQKQVITLAVQAGKMMMTNGAEVYRVEETIERICLACGLKEVEVFATPTGIIASVDSGEEAGGVYTKVKRVRNTRVDLARVSELNSFSRMFTTTEYSPKKGMDKLKEIDSIKPYKLWKRLFGAGIIAAFFCWAISHNAVDTAAAGAIGMMSYLFSSWISKYSINYFMNGMMCSAFATFFALLAYSTGCVYHYDAIIIGSIMIFVPGVAITNSIRDLLYGDMISGVARMAEACVVAVAQAAGAGIILKLWTMGGSLL